MFSAFLASLALFLSALAFAAAFMDRRAYTNRITKLAHDLTEAKNLLKRRGDLANEVAHEIKNPITAILCSAETLDLLIGDDLEEGHRKSLKYIKEYGDNLLKLVSDFLDISMAESGNFRTVPEPVEVLPVIDAISGLLECNANRKGITLQVDGPDNVQTYIDPRHLKQILFNLLHNAIKFTPEKGKIIISFAIEESESIVSISVKDNGVGIPGELLPTVFDIYCKDERDKQEGSGVGLGLALTKALVELSGGEIKVQSKEGEGTVFTFSVPLLENVKRRVSSSQNFLKEDLTEKHPLMGQHFLVVDQDRGARESLAGLIEAWGGVADRVDLATEAVKALSEKDYDAVMIDNTKDGVNGYDLTRQAKDQIKSEQTRLILTTKERLDPGKAKKAGASRYIEKPVNGKALLSTLLSRKDVAS